MPGRDQGDLTRFSCILANEQSINTLNRKKFIQNPIHSFFCPDMPLALTPDPGKRRGSGSGSGSGSECDILWLRLRGLFCGSTYLLRIICSRIVKAHSVYFCSSRYIATPATLLHRYIITSQSIAPPAYAMEKQSGS